MMREKIIQFDPKERILDKVGKYFDSRELFLEERETAVSLMLSAIKYADHALKQKIILHLGGFARREAAWPLYRMLADPEENEEIRYMASIQLRVIFPTLEDPDPLMDQLLKDLDDEDPEMRVYAASALGWQGNYRAAISLVSLLYDSDADVMQAAVNALTDLGDDRVFEILLDRLEHGPIEQKRCILFNLWHLGSRQDEVIGVYLEYLKDENAELRYDALVLLRAVTEPGQCLDAYLKCLKDEDPRIRLLALERIGESDRKDLFECRKNILSMVADPDLEVQAAAKKIMNLL